MAKAWHGLRDGAGRDVLPVAARFIRESPVAHWRKRICDHVAYALLVYTGLQIMLTMIALRLERGGVLPYLALLVLVGVVIPACRHMERRWTGLGEAAVVEPALVEQLDARFRRDRATVWACALGLPFALTGLFALAVALLS